MSLVGELIERLGDAIDALAGRVEGAIELSEMIRQKALPQATPFAFVIPAGIQPRSAGDAGANAFTQAVDDLVSVVLVVRTAGDVRGAKTQPKLETLVSEVVAAVAGFDPGGETIGVFRLTRGRVVEFSAGTVFYQLDFAIQNQIRILS
jgi:hypothetical protein